MAQKTQRKTNGNRGNQKNKNFLQIKDKKVKKEKYFVVGFI